MIWIPITYWLCASRSRAYYLGQSWQLDSATTNGECDDFFTIMTIANKRNVLKLIICMQPILVGRALHCAG